VAGLAAKTLVENFRANPELAGRLVALCGRPPSEPQSGAAAGGYGLRLVVGFQYYRFNSLLSNVASHTIWDLLVFIFFRFLIMFSSR